MKRNNQLFRAQYAVLLAGFILCITSNVYAQQLEGTRIKLNNGITSDSKFFVFPADYIVKADYTQMNQALNDCPEALLKSVLSATSQDWVDRNSYGGSLSSEKKSEKHFTTIKNMNHDLTYFELSHKFYFNIDDYNYCLVKYFIHSEFSDKIVSAVSTMVSKDGKWYTVKDYVSGMNALMFMRMKSDKLYDLLYNPTKDAILQSVYQKVNDSNGVNFNTLTNEFNSWYKSGNENYKKYFIDERAW